VTERPHRFSIVIPLSDDRQQSLAALDGWLHQDFPLASFELLLIAGPSEEPLVPPIVKRLRQQDQVLRVEGSSYAIQADAGCRAATQPLLVLTEAHVVPNGDCLARLAVWYERDGGTHDGASLKSYGINRTRMAELEQSLYDADYGSRMAPDHWNKVTVRGFTLPRRLYLESGGLDLRYGHFAELVWGYAMFQQGRRFTTVDDAIVGHFNNNDFESLAHDLLDFGRGMGRFRDDAPDHPLIALLPSSRTALVAESSRRMRAAWAGLWTGQRVDWTARDFFRTLRGPRWRLVRARIEQLIGRLRLAMSPRGTAAEFRNFTAIWNAIIAEGEADYFVR
jgi:hypothetical protein